jgi:predicted enzyme related to lactoylglutathione lyase
MPKRTAYSPGTPSYIDIGTADPKAAGAFYGALFGWTINDLGPDAGGYTMAQIDGDDVAGIGPAQNPGPPYWTTYFTVDDADATAKSVEAAGGTVLAPPFDVFDGGRMAVFADPNGAAFNVWQPKASIGAYRVNEHGTLCWNELNTWKLEAAKKFYSEVFGWTYEGDDTYAQPLVDGKAVGGMMPLSTDRMPAETPEHWLVYFAVDDVNKSAAEIKNLGGTTMMEPFDAGGVGKMVVAADPQGAVFAVIQLNQPGE